MFGALSCVFINIPVFFTLYIIILKGIVLITQSDPAGPDDTSRRRFLIDGRQRKLTHDEDYNIMIKTEFEEQER